MLRQAIFCGDFRRFRYQNRQISGHVEQIEPWVGNFFLAAARPTPAAFRRPLENKDMMSQNTLYLELRQYKNDSIQLEKKSDFEIAALFYHLY